MPTRKSLEHLRCSVANTAELIGDRWTVLILRDAFLGVRRFDDFQRDLGIAKNILADRLEMLVSHEIFTTRRYEDRPPRHEYLLTDKGKDLFDVLLTLWRWGDRWAPPRDADLRLLRHLDCGAETHAVVHCAYCGEPLDRRNVRLEPMLPVVASRSVASAT
ncbi:MAG: winged helix-turn-helix transcriptional regulator [Actinomycetota bacterium]